MGKQIPIIGAGISGLTACKHVIEKGFNPIVFEASNEIGGVWSSQTISCTKLQTPKNYYQFTDFPWPSSISDTFPYHKQVMEYLKAYAARFNIIDHIKSKSKLVVGIEYLIDDCPSVDAEGQMDSWELWGGNGEPFSPDFNIKEGPDVFRGKVLHSMDYAAMDDAMQRSLSWIRKL